MSDATLPSNEIGPLRGLLLGPRWGVDWLLLSVPIASAFRLKAELHVVGDDLLGAELLVAFSGPWFVALALLLGLRPHALVREPEPGVRRLLVASTARIVFGVVTSLIGLTLLLPPDLGGAGSHAWQLLGWLFGVALPLWAIAIALRLRGARTVGTFLVVGGVWSLYATALLGTALLTRLPPQGMRVPAAVGGAILAVGLWLAAWMDVHGRSSRLLAGVGLLALAAAVAVALRVGAFTSDTVRVTSMLDLDVASQRIAVTIERPAAALQSVVEVELTTGAWREFDRGVVHVVYAGGQRVMLRRSRLAQVLDLAGIARLCTSGDGVERCGPELPWANGLVFSGHDREPLVLASDGPALAAWDLESDRSWILKRPGRVLWPCFVADRGLYWRLATEEGPFDQELLRLDGPDQTPERLPLTHDQVCDDVGAVLPSARLRFGRRAAGTTTSLEGPGLEGGRIEVPGLVGGVWSGDGRVLAGMMGGTALRYYAPEYGLGPVEALPPSYWLALSHDGSRLAHTVWLDPDARLDVRSVPDHDVVASQDLDIGVVRWTDDGRLLLIRGGRLLRYDPATGVEEVLFPPAP
jgi:hypothetical protein